MDLVPNFLPIYNIGGSPYVKKTQIDGWKYAIISAVHTSLNESECHFIEHNHISLKSGESITYYEDPSSGIYHIFDDDIDFTFKSKRALLKHIKLYERKQ